MRSFKHNEPQSARVLHPVVFQLSPGFSQSLQKRSEVWFPIKRNHDRHIVHCDLHGYVRLFNLDLS